MNEENKELQVISTATQEARPGEVRLERTYRLDLRIGERMMLRLGWGDEKNSLEAQGELVGYGHYEFILVRLQPAPGLLPRICQGERVTVRFLSEGAAAIFQTEVIGHLTRPSVIVALAYPTVMNTVQVRRFKRVTCALPVLVSKGGQQGNAIISDISRGGCRMIMDVRGQSIAKNLAVDDKMEIHVPLDLNKPLEVIPVCTKNIETEQHRAIMGLAFESMPNQTGQLLDVFLTNTEILLA